MRLVETGTTHRKINSCKTLRCMQSSQRQILMRVFEMKNLCITFTKLVLRQCGCIFNHKLSFVKIIIICGCNRNPYLHNIVFDIDWVISVHVPTPIRTKKSILKNLKRYNRYKVVPIKFGCIAMLTRHRCKRSIVIIL